MAAGLPTVSHTDFGQSISLTNATCPTTAVLDGSSGGGKPFITLHYYNWGCPSANVTGTLSSATTAAACGSLRSDRVYSVNVNGTCVNLEKTRADGLNGVAPLEACNSYVGGDYGWATTQASAQLGDYDLAFVPGDYTVSIASGTGTTTQTFKLNAGDTSEVAVNLPAIGAVPAVFETNISFDDPRDLPNASTASIGSSCGGDRSYAVPASTTAQLKLKAFAASACVYTLAAGGRTVALDQSKTNNVHLHRVDVDHPVVTRENGSTYTTTGTYELFFGGVRVAGPFNTNTGVDVLGGTYELVTTFSTADGPQTQRETITL